MSWQVWPRKVDWRKFLRSFPKPANWTGDLKAELSWVDSRQHDSWGDCYVDMRKYLPRDTLFAIEWFVQATCSASLPKWKGFKLATWYKPHLPYEDEDYPGPGSGGAQIPLMSPGNVVDMLHCLRLRDHDRIAEDVRVAWDRVSEKGWKNDWFEGADRYLQHFREWQSIMGEIESRGAGFALDFS